MIYYIREALFGSVEELFLYYHCSTVIFYLGSMDEIINFDDFILSTFIRILFVGMIIISMSYFKIYKIAKNSYILKIQHFFKK